MNALILLGLIFGGVALMVILTQRFGKPLEAEEQAKYSKIFYILVFVLLIAALIKAMLA
ncbi:hypothetical protein [Flocculibacter collagenilyticus]|uniref:hypothetical protein n=1 Tax=Flocculibacter collagenilyticus TaxID=2744479 RepID=UPI0018F6B204|nr:hypothetical protein [Flocculibacter collagenilyticus]